MWKTFISCIQVQIDAEGTSAADAGRTRHNTKHAPVYSSYTAMNEANATTSEEDDGIDMRNVPRIKPDGESSVVDMYPPYKHCHYSLSNKAKRKIKRYKKRPNQIYMVDRNKREYPAPTSRETKKYKGTKDIKKVKLISSDEGIKECSSGEDEAEPRIDRGFFASQMSSDYAQSPSENHPSARSSMVSLAEDGEEFVHLFSRDDAHSRNPSGGETQVLNETGNQGQVPSAKGPGTQGEDAVLESDYNTDDDDDVGYKVRAKTMQLVSVEGNQSEHSSDCSDGNLE